MKVQFTDIIQSKDLKDISIELVDKVLDNEISNDILKEIPILKSLVAARNIYTSITDKIFIKKTMNVLLELGDINWKDRIELTSDLNDDDGSAVEKILMAINHLETTEKCKVYGRLCKLKALGKLDTDDFLRLTKLIQDAYLDDLYLVTEFKRDEKKKIHEGDYYPAISLGLIYQEPSEQKPIERVEQYNEYDPEFKGGDIEFYYRLSYLGQIMLKNYYDLFPADR